MRRTFVGLFRSRFSITCTLAVLLIGASSIRAYAQEQQQESSTASPFEEIDFDTYPVAEQDLDSLQLIGLPAVAGLPRVSCFALPVSNYRTQDGCLEFLSRNPDFANKRHAGDDFCATQGTRVNAIGAGKVMYARAHQTCPNWGHLIAIEHLLPNGSSVVSLYGHVVPSVREGDLVTRGQQVGTIGKYSCWRDHIHFAIAQRDYGAAVGTYASWVKGYLTDQESVSPYTNPASFLSSRSDCPPTVGNHTYSTQLLVTRKVSVRYTDPEGKTPSLRRIQYQYREPAGRTRTGTGDFILTSGSPGNGTYSWSATIYGTQFKFYTEWRDAGGNYVRYPESGWIE